MEPLVMHMHYPSIATQNLSQRFLFLFHGEQNTLSIGTFHSGKLRVKTIVFHNEDRKFPARANIKQALGYIKDGDGDGKFPVAEMSKPHKGVKASANSDVMYSFTSAQDGNPLQDDGRLCLGDDLKKAQDHCQRQAGDIP
ncbi:hypothetical protein Tco_0609966 [Tanacetum coccineum]